MASAAKFVQKQATILQQENLKVPNAQWRPLCDAVWSGHELVKWL